MKNRIREFLYSQLEEEKGLTACLIIHTMAKESEVRKKHLLEAREGYGT